MSYIIRTQFIETGVSIITFKHLKHTWYTDQEYLKSSRGGLYYIAYLIDFYKYKSLYASQAAVPLHLSANTIIVGSIYEIHIAQ